MRLKENVFKLQLLTSAYKDIKDYLTLNFELFDQLMVASYIDSYIFSSDERVLNESLYKNNSFLLYLIKVHKREYENILKEYEDQSGWDKWFAWYRIKISAQNKKVWFKSVQRKLLSNGKYVYKELK